MSNSGDDGAIHTSEATVIRDRSAALELVVEAGGGPAATAALVRAAEQARASRVPLRIVYVWQLSVEPAGATSESFVRASGADARARATRWVLDTLDDGAAKVRWFLEVVEGAPGVAVAATDSELELSS